MNIKYLFTSSLFFLIPILSFLYKKNKIKYEYILILSLLINTILSCIFWNNAKKNSLIHYIDVIFAKITFILFIIYVYIFKKDNIIKYNKIYLLIFIIYIYIYYSSNKYSTKDWYSTIHIIYHFIFHIISSCLCTNMLII